MSLSDHVILRLPFTGTWLARNSPARRVPSHGTDLFATTYAIDFIAVQGRRTAPTWDWRTLLTTEPAARFFASGSPSSHRQAAGSSLLTMANRITPLGARSPRGCPTR